MKKRNRLQYHPAFSACLQFMFWDYRKKLDYSDEHTLSKKPLQMDLLIIKKDSKLVIDNDIADIFRKYNIIEYKNPEDALSIDTLFKVICYAALYKSGSGTVNGFPADEISVSVFRHSYPRELFAELIRMGCIVSKYKEGIYRVDGLIYFPLQIIVTKELEGKEFAALKVLNKNASDEDIVEYIIQTEKHSEPGYKEFADSVFQVSIPLNRNAYERVRRNNPMCDALRELMKDVIDEEVKQGVAKGLAEGLAKGRAKGMAEGRAKGMAEGRAEGRAEGKAEGEVKGFTEACQQFGQSFSDCVQRLSEKFNFSESESKKYVALYWKQD